MKVPTVVQLVHMQIRRDPHADLVHLGLMQISKDPRTANIVRLALTLINRDPHIAIYARFALATAQAAASIVFANKCSLMLTARFYLHSRER